MFLGHPGELGGEVASAFTNAVNATVVQVSLQMYCKCTLAFQNDGKHPSEVTTHLLNITLPSILMQ